MTDNYRRAQRNYDRMEPEFQEEEEVLILPTLSEKISSWIKEGGEESMLAVCDFLIDEFRIQSLEEFKKLVS